MKIHSMDALAREFKDKGEEFFRRKYSHPFLVPVHIPPKEEGPFDPITDVSLLTRKATDPANQFERKVIALTKSDRNAFQSTITVGRAQNNDIIIRASKVSKLHAAFILEKDGRYQLMDMGSSNGTRVNNKRIKEKETAELKSGDSISLWRFEFKYHELDSFVHIIRVLAG